MALLFFSETKLVKETQTLGNKTPFADKHSSKLLDICENSDFWALKVETTIFKNPANDVTFD